MSLIVGIDLGTMKTMAAMVKDGKPILVPNIEGSDTTPAVVSVMPGGQFQVGARAQKQSILNPHATRAESRQETDEQQNTVCAPGRRSCYGRSTTGRDAQWCSRR